MTERGLPSADGAPACPFVAFSDDREARSTSPDHRHRCFAETPPAPRAVAHQEAYCLSSAFPVCPTFQDWAKREAAHARGAGAAAESAPIAIAVDDPAHDWVDEDGSGQPLDFDDVDDGSPEAPPIRRNPPRDWAAPPPWATGQAAAGSMGGRIATPSPDVPKEGQGLAGSAADRLAAGLPVAEVAPVIVTASGSVAIDADDELAGLAQSRSAPRSPNPAPPSRPQPEVATARPPASGGKRPAVSSTRSSGPVIAGPSWEQMRRYEAYPTIKTRAGLPGIPRIAVLAGALGVAALVLFMLPALLGVGGGGTADPSATASVPVVTDSPEPTVPPEPTPTVYVVKTGDSLGKIADNFGLSIDELLAANPSIKNPNKITVGQEIVIPVPDAPA